MGKQLREIYDLVVVGGGPAGATAALRASQQGASVLVVAQDEFPRTEKCVGWVGPPGVGLCKECGVTLKKARAVEFRGMRLHSWDLKRTARIDDPELRGWLVDRAAFDRALLKAATGAGAEALRGVEVQDLRLGEERAVLQFSEGREVAGKVVLIANGVASPTARVANLTPAGDLPDVPQHACVEYTAREVATGLDVAVGANRAGQLATIVRFGKTVRLSVVARAAQIPIEEQFRAFCGAALQGGLLPEGVPGQPARRTCPGGMALDMETHVGKRCLLIGEAGGFVAAFSSEGIYPAMRSGWIAAETALRALQAPVVQDELASFGAAWRSDMADYLRMPNTDLSLLVPLVFNNEQMSRRVARAFLLGQPF